MSSCPHTKLHASEEYVGLPAGVMGNSEVGHENIGAGRIVKQKLTMISDMIKSGEFFDNQELKKSFAHVKKNLKKGIKSKMHFMGLMSEGDVHSHLGHLDGLIEMAKREGLDANDVYLHAISDGRDDPPYVAESLMKRYQDKVQVATVSGRYWAMDRDNNWERTQKYLDCVVAGTGLSSASAAEAISDGYALAEKGDNPVGDSDEFILPTIINEAGLIEGNDSVVFFNFRPDRARQISKALGEEGCKDKNKLGFKDFSYTCFTLYDEELTLPIAFSNDALPKQDTSKNLAECVSDAGFKQFRIAETEKYNHVTRFINGGHIEAYHGEERTLVPSPKVATYDLKPEMSLPEVTDALVEAMSRSEHPYQMIICNFANPDMVGHTGDWNAVLTALAVVDEKLKLVAETAKKHDYALLVTADHGNADEMVNKAGEVRTAHSTNRVPLIVYNSKEQVALRQPDGSEATEMQLTLSNIAPTMLEVLSIEKPNQMSSESLFI